MANIIVVGAQWGDEGKGKVVDFLSERFDVVARYQGGQQRGPHRGGRGRQDRPPPDPLGRPAKGQDLRPGQRGGHRPRRADPGDGPARAAARQVRGPFLHQPPRAPGPAVPQAAGRGPRAARHQEDRHHGARDRPGLRGQDGPGRDPGRRPAPAGAVQGATLAEPGGEARPVPGEPGARGARTGPDIPRSSQALRADPELPGGCLAGPRSPDAGRQAGSLRRRPGDAAGRGPGDLSVCHLVQRHGGRGLHRHRREPEADRRRPGHLQGLHDPRRRGAVPDGAGGRDRGSDPRARCRVRGHHGPPAADGLVRRRRAFAMPPG